MSPPVRQHKVHQPEPGHDSQPVQAIGAALRCGEVLARVVVAGRSTWAYDQGHYDNIENKEATLSCPGCGTCLNELFEEGIYYWGIK